MNAIDLILADLYPSLRMTVLELYKGCFHLLYAGGIPTHLIARMDTPVFGGLSLDPLLHQNFIYWRN